MKRQDLTSNGTTNRVPHQQSKVTEIPSTEAPQAGRVWSDYTPKENLQHLWWSIKSMLEVIGQRIKVLQAERTTNIYADNNGYIAADPRLEAKSEEVQPEQTPNTTSPAAIEQPDY